jgi:FkbM family methyltransferase
MIVSRMKYLARTVLPRRAVEAIDVARGKRRLSLILPQAERYTSDDPSVLQCFIAYNKHGGYCIPLATTHRFACQLILRGEIPEPETIEFVTSHCKDGDIVHAGTFFGDFLPAFSRACAPGARIWAFEPDVESYRCAIITSHINKCININLTNSGLAEKQDSRTMVTTHRNGQSLGGAKRIVEEGTEMADLLIDGLPVLLGATNTVRVTTVDETVPPDRHVSIIQLDVERYEKPALSGAMNTIRRCLPILILETPPEESWMAENILSLGYRETQKLHDNTVFRCD